jgi:hypothetical protein
MTEAENHEDVRRLQVYIHVFLSSKLDGGKLSAARPSLFVLSEKSRITMGRGDSVVEKWNPFSRKLAYYIQVYVSTII